MDVIKKKVLDDRLPYITQNLMMTQEFYGHIIQAGIFTDEMLNGIKVSLIMFMCIYSC
jgi:hypothetical protein